MVIEADPVTTGWVREGAFIRVGSGPKLKRVAMKFLKEYLFSWVICILFLVVLFAVDESYEDSIMSAQVLDEAIAQAYEDQKNIRHELIAYQDEVIKH